jgi:hypothetical protein
VVVELSPAARESLGVAAARAGAGFMRDESRCMLCDACDVLGLEVPSRTNPDGGGERRWRGGGDGDEMVKRDAMVKLMGRVMCSFE